MLPQLWFATLTKCENYCKKIVYSYTSLRIELKGDIHLKELQTTFRLERELGDMWLKCLNNLADFLKI